MTFGADEGNRDGKRLCQNPECDRDAEYEVWSGPRSDDFTLVCLRCIPLMLTDSRYHEITRL